MVVTENVNLPTYETLTVPEVNLSTASLVAGSSYLGKQCEAVNNEFMLCRQELGDARACIDIGKKVTHCAMEVFKAIKKNCREEFDQYAHCIDQSSGHYLLSHCRKTQAVFDECMLDKLCWKRPDFGYFTRGKIHRTGTPYPPAPPCPCHPKVPDPTPSLPDCKPRPPPRLGSRLFWITE